MKAKLFIRLKSVSADLVFSKFLEKRLQHALNKYGLPNSVYLLAFECESDKENFNANSTEILITESLPVMRSFIELYFDNYIDGSDINVYFQEYDTYEYAYNVALKMREQNKKCYDEDKL
jgi:hypothetical protein